MLARENPHWGNSGVPFINNTTGAEWIALEMAERVVSLRYLLDADWVVGVSRRWNEDCKGRGRRVRRSWCGC